MQTAFIGIIDNKAVAQVKRFGCENAKIPIPVRYRYFCSNLNEVTMKMKNSIIKGKR